MPRGRRRTRRGKGVRADSLPRRYCKGLLRTEWMFLISLPATQTPRLRGGVVTCGWCASLVSPRCSSSGRRDEEEQRGSGETRAVSRCAKKSRTCLGNKGRGCWVFPMCPASGSPRRHHACSSSAAPSSPLMDSTQVLGNGHPGIGPLQEGITYQEVQISFLLITKANWWRCSATVIIF